MKGEIACLVPAGRVGGTIYCGDRDESRSPLTAQIGDLLTVLIRGVPWIGVCGRLFLMAAAL